jgi:hypothetical protein
MAGRPLILFSGNLVSRNEPLLLAETYKRR